MSVKGPPVNGATVTEIKFVGVFNKLLRCWFAATSGLEIVVVLLLFVITFGGCCPDKLCFIWAPFGFSVVVVAWVEDNVLLSRLLRGCE